MCCSDASERLPKLRRAKQALWLLHYNTGFPKTEYPLVPNLVEIRDLEFAYGDRKILSNLRMDFPRGKLIAVMGGSGCGKTTVLRLIGGQIRPQRGEVRVGGEAVHKLNTEGLYRLRRRMGMLFQFGALFTDLTIFENVAFPLREHTNLSEELIRNLVLMKLNAVGLRNASKLKPGEISGGMARRVAVARAIALDPELIMYDEPFAGLDPISMGLTASLIRNLNDALGSTSILVSHDVNETFAIADYVYFMSAGKIVAEGTPAELRVSTDPYVKQFVNAEPDGPVPFHYPGKSLADDLGLGTQR
ncbi:MAG: transporter ATP-binding protein [Massilia sp.]|nr:transporter ATP-binding protein [Massilia sp.]